MNIIFHAKNQNHISKPSRERGVARISQTLVQWRVTIIKIHHGIHWFRSSAICRSSGDASAWRKLSTWILSSRPFCPLAWVLVYNRIYFSITWKICLVDTWQYEAAYNANKGIITCIESCHLRHLVHNSLSRISQNEGEY